MPTEEPDPPLADLLRAIDAGILALVHQLSRDLAEVRSTHGGAMATLRAEWTATDLAALALLRSQVEGGARPTGPGPR